MRSATTRRRRPSSADAPAAAGQTTGSPDGTWTLGAKPGYVGYRVQELFAGETIRKDAVGRTTQVKGTLVFAGSQLKTVNVTANLQSLKSDRAPRDSFLHSNALETDSLSRRARSRPSTPASPRRPDPGRPSTSR